MLFLNITFLGISQTTSVNQNSKELKFEDKSKIKTAEKNPREKESQNSADTVSAEPVIIQRLEYKQENIFQNESSQENNYSVNPVLTQKSNENTTESTKKSIEEQIIDLETYLIAIEKKVEWVKNNPEEHSKAKENGWYMQMQKSYSDALIKRDLLINSKK